MVDERIRNQETVGTITEEERIAHEEAICWAEYETAQHNAEEDLQKQCEAEVADYFGNDKHSNEGVVIKDRSARHIRRKSAGRESRKIKKNAEVASKSLRKRKEDAKASAESSGKPVSAIQRCNNLISQAEKRKLI